MKATGIVRRIDDLGRVVIPKEIRRTLRIREGDPLEIFTDREGEIILKKYSPIGEMGTFAGVYAECLAQTTGSLVCICDKDQVIAASGSRRKELAEKYITKELTQAIEKRELLRSGAGEVSYVPITEQEREGYEQELICPVICEGDTIGAVILLGREGSAVFGEPQEKLARCAAIFLARQMEQ